jgi:hypothetical protein
MLQPWRLTALGLRPAETGDSEGLLREKSDACVVTTIIAPFSKTLDLRRYQWAMSGDTLLCPTGAITESSATRMASRLVECLCWNELAVTAAPSNGARARYSVSNRDLSKRYGLPIDISPKMGSLAAMARALDRGDLVHASIAALHLQLPDPPELAKSPPAVPEVIELARNLKASGLLKADWDPTKHPRWPAGSPGGIGGEFSASGSANLDSPIVEPNPKLLPVQLTIPAPFEIPGIPLPSEVLPAPFLPPNVSPLHIPRNPYPGRRRCVKEWTEAIDYCLGLWTKGWLARGDYRGSGRTISECIMGRVSQDCGGNRLDS